MFRFCGTKSDGMEKQSSCQKKIRGKTQTMEHDSPPRSSLGVEIV